MLLDLRRKKLYTASGKLIKKLECPRAVCWEEMAQTDGRSRECTQCGSPVLDTEKFSGGELLKIMQQNPETCLKVDVNQDNIRVKYYGSL